MRPTAVNTALVLVLLAFACNGDDGADGGDAGGGRCLDALPLDCEPLYRPTFQDFYDRQIVRTCGAAGTGGSCHSPEGEGKNGLVLGEADDAYRALLDDSLGTPRVIRGDPECSLLVRRLESDDPRFVMPPRMKLTDRELCSIRLWIARGAVR